LRIASAGNEAKKESKDFQDEERLIRKFDSLFLLTSKKRLRFFLALLFLLCLKKNTKNVMPLKIQKKTIGLSL
jgi:hypothetical protein